MTLKRVDAVDVTIVMDLYLDLLIAGAEDVRRFSLAYDWADRDNLLAEHGFSALVSVESDGRRTSILYDGGLSPKALGHNLDVMQIDVKELRAIAISHGHVDHHGGLEGLFRRHGRTRMPLVIHPDAWMDRKMVFPTGTEIHMPAPRRADLEQEGLEVIDERGPTYLIDDQLLLSGEVERITDFEKGFPPQQALKEGVWEPDPWTWDDQNLVVNVKDRGLVVVSACSHAGAVNVLRNAQRLTGEQQIAGFIGGFHLTGAIMEPFIPRTIAEMAEMRVERLVPAHCSGWKATHELARMLPDAFVQPSVGTTFRFASSPDLS